MPALLMSFLLLGLPAFGTVEEDWLLPPVAQYQDKDSAGWANKSDDQAFVAQVNGCKVKWNVWSPKEKDKPLTIEARSECEKRPEMLYTLSEHVFGAIMKKYPAERFGQLVTSQWCSTPEVSERLAVAAMNLLAKDKKKRKVTFKEAFKAGDGAREWSDLFLSYRLILELEASEKHTETAFHKLPFASKYPKYKNKKTVVPTASQSCTFKLTKS